MHISIMGLFITIAIIAAHWFTITRIIVIEAVTIIIKVLKITHFDRTSTIINYFTFMVLVTNIMLNFPILINSDSVSCKRIDLKMFYFNLK